MRKRFLLYAMLSLAVLLSVLLAVINGINFTMAAADADRVTDMLAAEQGRFDTGAAQGSAAPPEESAVSPPASEGERGGRMGPMGPSSPELRASVRYFTFRFDADGNAEAVAMQVSALTEEEARALAEKLVNESTGWVKFTYRYRVYRQNGYTYVTVIDQGRELLPSYRILLISLAGEALGLLVCFAFLQAIGKRLFRPLAEADAKQKLFIADAERALKIPLTVLAADAELLSRESGPTETASSLHRQIKKITALVKKLGELEVFGRETAAGGSCDLSHALLVAVDRAKERFAEKGIVPQIQLEPAVTLRADPETVARICGEIVENAHKFALTDVSFSLSREGERIRLVAANDAALAEAGDAERVFDRFTVLENAPGNPGDGLGLAFLKEAVKATGGRVHAAVADGRFTLRIVW